MYSVQCICIVLTYHWYLPIHLLPSVVGYSSGFLSGCFYYSLPVFQFSYEEHRCGFSTWPPSPWACSGCITSAASSPSSHPFQPLSWSSDGDKVFSEVFKTWETADGLCLKVKEKMVRRIADSTDDSLIVGNASTGGREGRGTESTVITVVDTVMTFIYRKPASQKELMRNTSRTAWNQSKGSLVHRDQKA